MQLIFCCCFFNYTHLTSKIKKCTLQLYSSGTRRIIAGTWNNCISKYLNWHLRDASMCNSSINRGPSWWYGSWIYNYLCNQGPSWRYGCWIYNYLCNQCLSPLMLRDWIPPWRGVLHTTLCDKVCHDLQQVSGFLRVLMTWNNGISKHLNQLLTDASMCNRSINHLYQCSNSGSCEPLV
jgi:hypothetical protein